MTQAVQLRKGTTSEHASFTGLQAEATVDTTKKTIVIHDGSTAGGVPLSREDLSNSNPTNLSAINGADTASSDLFVVYDVSASALKKITRAELNNAIEQDALASVAITGGTINNTAIGGSTAAAGSFTTLTTSSTVTLNGGTANGVLYLNGSKVATSGSALTFDGSLLTQTVSDAGTSNKWSGATGKLRLRPYADSTYGAIFDSTNPAESAYLPLSLFASNIYSAADTASIWRIAGSEQMRLTSTGLGIGTSSPSAPLVVNKTGWAYSGNAYLTGVFVDGSGNKGVAVGYDNTSQTGIIYPFTTSAASSLSFWTYPGSGSITERMRLDSSGNLGIGTSSPTQKFHVESTTNAQGLFKTTGSGGGSNRSSVILQGPSNTWYINTNGSDLNGSDGALGFYGNSATRMVIDSSGNLGLGVTPSVWAGITAAMQLGDYGNITSTGTRLWLGTNYYYNSGEKYTGTGLATRYRQSDGLHIWDTAPSGTAGNAISFTQAMTLDASGNLGVGTTVISSAYGFGRSLGVSGGNAEVYVEGSGGKWSFGTDGNGNGYIQGPSPTTLTNGTLSFNTRNTERARITSGGYFKASNSGSYVGSTGSYHEFVSNEGSATAAVYIRNTNASSPAGIDLSYSGASPNGTGNTFLYCQDSTALRTSIRSNGGLANYQSNNVDLSDARTKKDITPAPSYWNKIAALEIVTYKYNDQTHDDINVGVIAQQVESVEPVWVDADGFGKTPEDGVPLKTVYTKDITFAAIKALQEAMARIETLEAKVSALEGN